MKKNTRRYFQNDQTHSDTGLNVITAGCCSYEPGERYPHPAHPKDHLFNWNNGRILNGYYLVFITKGKGVFETQHTGSVKVEEGNILVLFPGMWHRYRPIKETGWEEYWVGFNGPYADALMKHKLFNPASPVVRTGLNQQLIQCYQLMINSHFIENQDFYSFLCGIILQMIGLVQMINSHYSEENTPLQKSMERAFFLMHDRVEQSINFEQLAKEVGLSYPWFRKMFKENNGIAPNQYFLDLKIQRAAELLRSTNLSISEISYFFDFNSPFYFSRIFKKKTGLNPSDYREKQGQVDL